MPKKMWQQGCGYRKRGGSEHGIVLFYFILLAPLLLFFMSYLLDSWQFELESARARELSDRAGQIAMRKLPHTDLAESAVSSFLKRYGKGFAGEFQSSPDSFNVQLAYSSRNFYALSQSAVESFFRPSNPSKKKSPAKAQALTLARTSLQRRPRDILLYIDNGALLAPALLPTSQVKNIDQHAWREPRKNAGSSSRTPSRTQWPAASYFRNQKNTSALAQYHPVLATQQCFNPIFSAMKKAGIRLYEYFSRLPGNQVGVMIGPFDSRSAPGTLAALRPLGPAGSDRVFFPDAMNPHGISDRDCFEAARQASRVSSSRIEYRYRLPDQPDFAQGKVSCGRLSCMCVQDAIWSRAAQNDSVNITDILARTSAEVFGAPHTSRAIKGEVADASIWLLLADFPRENGVRFPSHRSKKNPYIAAGRSTRLALEHALMDIDAIAHRRQQNLRIFFVVARHFGNYDKNTPHVTDESCVNADDSFDLINGLGESYCDDFFAYDGNAFLRFINDVQQRLQRVEVQFVRIPSHRALGETFIQVASRVEGETWRSGHSL